MAADRGRLAAALAYKQAEEERRRRMMESIPTPAGTTPAQPAPQADFRTNLENLSIGLGEGLTNQLEGIKGLVTDPVGTAKGVYEAGKAVVRDPAIIASALRQMGQKAMSGPLGAGEVIGEMVGPMRGKTPMAELDVYHGTPHRFPATEANPLGEFDASKIGTGEGAQTFGHGIYLTQKPEIAEYYKNTIQADPQEFVDGEPFDDLNPNHLAAFYAAQHTGNWGPFDPEEAAKFAERGVGEPHQQAAALLRQSKFGKYTAIEPGTVYKADLPDEMIDRMLDWDKPLSEQPAAIKNLFPTLEEAKAINAEMIRLSEATLAANDINGPAQAAWEAMYKSPQYKMAQIVVDEADPKLGKKFANGQRIYRAISGGDDKASAEQLRAFGIPGIKYLDAGSRGQGGSGTRNFVVFPGEEKKVKILERDGKRVAEMLQRTAPGSAKVEADLYPLRGRTPVAYWNADKTVPASSIVEVHGVRDKNKRDALQADMEVRGWSGRPLLAYRDDSGAIFALTGSHRIAAARAADIDVPIVLVSDASMQHVDEIGRYLPEIAGKDDNDVLQFLENAGDKRGAELMRLEVRFNNENDVIK